MTNSSSTTDSIGTREILGFLLYALINPAALFLSAGTFQWTEALILTGITIPLTLGSRYLLIRRYPELAQERSRGKRSAGVKSWDRFLSAAVGLYGNLAILIVAGLDRRFQWTGGFFWAATLAGGLVVILGYLLGAWALLENRFFSAVVRIQTERRHQVCDTGPYRWIRHPGYAGSLLYYLAVPFLLNRAWAFIPSLLTVFLLIVRTHLEDRTLREELPGYEEYASQVPFRLIPGLW